MDTESFLTRLEAVNLHLFRLGVREADLNEQFVHSGGKGGQNVNKVSTAVRLRYKDEDVKCMEERSQFLNRVRAREILAQRIENKREQAGLAKRAEFEKARKLKAGRPRAIKGKKARQKRTENTAQEGMNN